MTYPYTPKVQQLENGLFAINGKILIGAVVRSPLDKVRIKWEVDGSSGSTICEAWRGQYEIDCLVKAGYEVLSVGLA